MYKLGFFIFFYKLIFFFDYGEKIEFFIFYFVWSILVFFNSSVGKNFRVNFVFIEGEIEV